jgi:hypothetical protein
MAEHKLAPGRVLIEGLKDLGQGLGYYAEGEHPVKEGPVNPPAVDVAWKADKEQPFPLMIFEVESVAGNAMANNAVKVFAQPTDKFEKPLFFFHVVLKSGEDNSPIENLKLQYGAANYGLYRIDHDEKGMLIADILSQHRRHQRAIDLLMLYEHLGHKAWAGTNLDRVFEQVEALGFQTNYLNSYALLGQRDNLFQKRFLNRLYADEAWKSGEQNTGYETYIGGSWCDPIHLALLAREFGDANQKFLESLKFWQEKSSYMSMIGPHFGLSHDYDEFVLGLSPAFLAITAAIWGTTSEARAYLVEQCEKIFTAIPNADASIFFFNGTWLLHLAAGLADGKAYDRVRISMNKRGGLPLGCLYAPAFLISIEDETDWDEQLKGAPVLVPEQKQFIEETRQRYPKSPTHSEAISLGIDILIKPEYNDTFAMRTIEMLVPRPVN